MVSVVESWKVRQRKPRPTDEEKLQLESYTRKGKEFLDSMTNGTQLRLLMGRFPSTLTSIDRPHTPGHTPEHVAYECRDVGGFDFYLHISFDPIKDESYADKFSVRSADNVTEKMYTFNQGEPDNGWDVAVRPALKRAWNKADRLIIKALGEGAYSYGGQQGIEMEDFLSAWAACPSLGWTEILQEASALSQGQDELVSAFANQDQIRQDAINEIAELL